MFSISKALSQHLREHSDVTFEVLNPDNYGGYYAGQAVQLHDKTYHYHTLRSWVDLATSLECRMLTPTHTSKETIILHFQRYAKHSFHNDTTSDKSEKYGIDSEFSKINKNEEPAFLVAYLQALSVINLKERTRILNLGVNQGDEFLLMQEILGDEAFEKIDFVGIDHSASAINQARKRFNTKNVTFHAHDINALSELDLGSFDLILSIGTLQSPGINYKPFLMQLVQSYLTQDGTIILGFPNSRWIDGEMVYGAKMRNYKESDLSLMLGDIDYAKRYLQQKKFQVRINGKEYMFLSATR